MDLSFEAINAIVHPTAAFLTPTSTSSHASSVSTTDSAVSWTESPLNPATRIPSLSPLPHPLWRIEGSGGLGTHFFAYPLFLPVVPPLRLDVFIPPQPSISPALRAALSLGTALHTKDTVRLSPLGIVNYLVRALQSWTEKLEDPTAWYMRQVFGTRIILQDMPMDPSKASIKIAAMHALESQLHSVQSLISLWGKDVQLPPAIDISRVHVVRQFQDSVSLVHITDTNSSCPQTFVLKTLTSFPKFLYHELHVLLTLAPSSNIICPPIHLITKKCGFGGKHAVIGFLSEYHSPGALRDILPVRRLSNTLSLHSQLTWALQITRSLIHIRHSGLHYPDLRLDNVLLDANDNAIMIDFEQRGVWCEFGPPEINYIDYIRILATSECIEPSVKQQAITRLDRLCPDWEFITQSEQYHGKANGFHLPWLILRPTEQERAEVYMLGRLLWCIFEGVSAPQKATVWQSYAQESHLEFPEYQRTPDVMRELIDRCTRGRKETLGGRKGPRVVRQGSQMVVEGISENVSDCEHEELAKAIARDFWLEEVRAAEEWLDVRDEKLVSGTWDDNHHHRPCLQEVLEELVRYAQDEGVKEY